MSVNESALIHRRQFLQGAVTVIGVVALGISSTDSKAAVRVQGAGAALGIAYWDGERLTRADQLSHGDASLSSVKLVIRAAAKSDPSINAIDLLYSIPLANGQQYVPHFAWSRTANRPTRAVATMPVANEGVRISINSQGLDTLHSFTVGPEEDALKLRTGTYIVAAGSPRWAMYDFEASVGAFDPGRLVRRSIGGFVPVNFDYVTVAVEKA